MKYKILTLVTSVFLLSSCASTPKINTQSVMDCTGLGVIEVNGFDKNSHLFNKNDPYYIKRYAPHTAFEEVKVIGCTNVSSGERLVRLYTPTYRQDIKYGSYYHNQSQQQIFQLFISSTASSHSTTQQGYQTFNQRIAALKSQSSTVPKDQPDWYVDIEKSSNQPILVSNARDSAMLGLMANRTIALTKDDVLEINTLMTEYWEQ
ncbi:hypothetical protein [Psychrobacter glacincola]|uniref:hypothetical protein n=1 Tax=Psychrobacter glacincola TaxID=56810 RepID=UPI0039B02CCF